MTTIDLPALLDPERRDLDFRDLLLALAVMAANPVLYRFDMTLFFYPPDVTAYMVYAEQFFTTGNLYLEGWNSANAGLILPPLYPILVGLGSLLSAETLAVAEKISEIAAIGTAALCYLLMRSHCSRLLSAFGAALIGFSYELNLFAHKPLTESLFVFVLLLSLLLLQHSLQNHRLTTATAAGLFCTAVFLTRQIGLVYVVFGLVFIWLWFFKYRSAPKVAVGFSLGAGGLFLIFSVLLYAQTSQSPLTQHFSTGQEIALPSDLTEHDFRRYRELRAVPIGSYEGLLQTRRDWLQLTEDGLNFISVARQSQRSDQGDSKSSIIGHIFSGALANPAAAIERARNNFTTLFYAVGPLWSTLFLISVGVLLAPRIIPASARDYPIPGFIFCYTIAVSLITDKIDRYLTVIVPVILLQSVIGLSRISSIKPVKPLVTQTLALGLMTVGFWTLPVNFTTLQLSPRIAQSEFGLAELAAHVETEDTVMAISPLYSYLLGGIHRTLPNDSLERTIKFAQSRKIKWLFVSHSSGDKNLVDLYRHAPWLSDPLIHLKHPKFIKFCCRAHGGQFLLYEFIYSGG